MAERRVKSSRGHGPRRADRPDNANGQPEVTVGRGSLTVRSGSIAAAVLSGMVVACFHFPVDSTEIEAGRGLYVAWVAIAVGTFAAAMLPSTGTAGPPASGSWRTRVITNRSMWLDGLPWMLAAWMFVAAWTMASVGDWRKSTNEVWWWVTAAAVWIAARRALASRAHRSAIATLIIAASVSLALQAAYQHWVVLPDTWAQYQADPEKILSIAGIDAPPGSAERMIFENRLLDGGASATFALANSLAAVLTLAMVLVAMAWPTRRPPPSHRSDTDTDDKNARGANRGGWQYGVYLAIGFAVAVIGTGLLITRSRSAIASVAIMLTAGWVWRFRVNTARRSPSDSPSDRSGNRSLSLRLAIAGAVFAAIGTMIVMFGRPEWVEAAPASLATRVQYWQSTAQLLLDFPLTGAGPGNFQTLYEHYRSPTASEQIADPHNFLIETLSSGGVIAGILLLGWAAWVGAAFCGPRPTTPAGEPAEDQDSVDGAPIEEETADPSRDGVAWIYGGAAVGLTIAWLFRYIGGDSDTWWIFAADAVGVGWAWVWTQHEPASPSPPTANQPASSPRPRLGRPGWAFGLAALLVHLSIAGGWTVPGIGLLFWVGMGSLVGGEGKRWRSFTEVDRGPIRAAVIAGAGCLMMAVLYLASIVPVESATGLLDRAAYAQSRGNLGRATQSILDATLADPHNTQAALWRSEQLHWQLVMGASRNREEIRRQWTGAIDETLRRGGQSASLHREVIQQRLHVFQRHGDRRDLDAAFELLQTATQYSPSGEWYWAQLAVVAQALGKAPIATAAAQRATTLSENSGNIERALERQLLCVPENLGRSAAQTVLRPASELLPSVIPAGT